MTALSSQIHLTAKMLRTFPMASCRCAPPIWLIRVLLGFRRLPGDPGWPSTRAIEHPKGLATDRALPPLDAPAPIYNMLKM